ncbi:metallophosphoesterase [Roseibacterium sp. SDUM158016]|uniref:metallophosphoesterase n=1 Tax=Roseicyclus sediminis TaxID=2980997 RepID=UPI0021D01333|nr:metallophosphoesterase [Roseibacterium sp. SDUM158016]MCU4651684.1 metallophosphoesterase [Roseibacterium sp. SDUM158016]
MSGVAVTRYAVGGLRDVAVPRLSVALLSDFHASTRFMDRPRIAGIVDQANALRADLVLLLGDYAGHVIGGRSLAPEDVAEELARLSAPLGVFSVFGNHDWYNDPAPRMGEGQPTTWHRAFAAKGIPTLSNEVLPMEAGGVPFRLAGLESQRAFVKKRRRRDRAGRPGADDLGTVMDGLDPSLFTLLMAHEPDVFPELAGHVDLTVSGHTHGGQIVPFGRPLVVPSRHGTRYAYGHFAEGTRQMVVCGGLGFTTIPLRIGRPPEIVVLELGAPVQSA